MSPRLPEESDQSYENYQKNQSQRPADIKFIQQRLPTYNPVLNTAYVLPSLFLLASVFIPLGVGIWYFSENIQEIEILYSDNESCKSLDDSESRSCEQILTQAADDLDVDHNDHALDKKGRANSVADRINRKKKVRKLDEIVRIQNKIECNCKIEFELEKDMNGKVYIYYALTNFYQNHLRYYLNRDENQLKGNIFNGKDELRQPSSACSPYDYEFPDNQTGRIIIPCGLQANTMFNDVIELVHIDPVLYPLYENGERKVPLIRTGIAWDSDKQDKFQNPPGFENPKDPIWLKFMKPPSWKKNIFELDLINRTNNGLENEDFMVWMKTAAFPDFRKLHRIVNSSISPFQQGLPKGKYALLIEYNYRVSSFDGTKSIILTTSRMRAGKNPFLAIAYMVTGAILLVLTFIFLAVHIKTRKRNLDFKLD